MTEKKKNTAIVFLSITLVILLLFLVLSVTENKSAQNVVTEKAQSQTETLTSQPQRSQISNDTSVIEKENVCINFLKTYYSVQHSTSKAASLPECKAYLTERLYNQLIPKEDGTEYAQDEVDVDYTSSITVKDTYISQDDSDELIVRSTIKRTVNEMQSVNEYFISLKLEYVSDEWLVDDFELISVQGG